MSGRPPRPRRREEMKRRLFLLSGPAALGLDAPWRSTHARDAGSTASKPDARPPGVRSPSSGARKARVPGYPFGARLVPYAAGIRPSQTSAAMDALLTKQYDAWKRERVVPATSIVAGGHAVKFSDSAYLTVSEGMGYGMLLAVLFAGHDANAQQMFDGLLAVVRRRHAHAIVPFDRGGRYLMDWRLDANGTSAGDGWNAMDGDLDIAMALLMAHRQWGSAGAWDYLQEARHTIAALKSWCMARDGTTKGLAKPNVSRTSDYMIGHFRAFQAATGDHFWDTAIDRAYHLANRMQTVYSAGVGLMPDFVVGTDTATPHPSPGFMGDGNRNENRFWWNACRNPWRYASDYVLSGDNRWKTVTRRMVDFFNKQVAAAAGDVTVIGTGYNLDGTRVTAGNSPAFMAPIMVGGCVDESYQSLVDALWKWNATHLTTGYYDGEIQLLSMVVAAGNWWTTADAPTPSRQRDAR